MSLDPVLETIANPATSARWAEEVLTRLLSALRKGKIEAIKHVRSESGMALKEAKDYVDELVEATRDYIRPAQDKSNDEKFMIFRENREHEWQLQMEQADLLSAKSEANWIVNSVPETQRLLVVKVVGQTKLVLKMEDE